MPNYSSMRILVFVKCRENILYISFTVVQIKS